MKVTFITGHLCKERHALLNELALDLGEYGAQVTVLTGYPSRRINDEVRDYYLQHPVEQISPNVVVKRIGNKNGEGNGLAERMLKYVKLTHDIYKEAFKTETDVFYIYSSPPFLGYMGCKLAKKAPTLYNAQDLFPDTLVHMKHLSNKNPLITWFRHKEKQTYLNNTRIVTISQEMKRAIASTGCPSEKIDVIYNWADTENLHHVPKSENKLMDELEIDKSKFIVSYAGDIGLFQGWDVILDAAKLLMKIAPEVLFVIIGSGSYKEKLESRIANEGISNVEVRPLQPASRLSEIYSVGDIELVPIEKGITRMALPSKIGVIMSTGSPVLALVDSDSNIADVIKINELGYSIEHGNNDKLAELIKTIYIRKSELPLMGEHAKAHASINFSRKEQTKKYYNILSTICKGD